MRDKLIHKSLNYYTIYWDVCKYKSINEFSKKFFKQVNFCPFTHAVSEGANVYFQFEIIIPLKNWTLTISYQQREDTRNFSATHSCGGNPVRTWRDTDGRHLLQERLRIISCGLMLNPEFYPSVISALQDDSNKRREVVPMIEQCRCEPAWQQNR